jgi:hypothetical protein
MSVGCVQAAAAAMRAAYDAMATLPVEALTAVELVEVLDALETSRVDCPFRAIAC